MKTVVAMGLVFLSYSTSLLAQQTLVGKYAGNYIQKTVRGDETRGLTLEITGADDGKLKGTANSFEKGTCAGKYEVEGTYQDNKIVVRSVGGGGAASDCSLRLQLVAEGNKLVGKFGPRDVELSRQ